MSWRRVSGAGGGSVSAPEEAPPLWLLSHIPDQIGEWSNVEPPEITASVVAAPSLSWSMGYPYLGRLDVAAQLVSGSYGTATPGSVIASANLDDILRPMSMLISLPGPVGVDVDALFRLVVLNGYSASTPSQMLASPSHYLPGSQVTYSVTAHMAALYEFPQKFRIEGRVNYETP